MSAFYEAALPAAAIFLILAAAYRASRRPKNTRPVTESTQPVTRRATTCTQRGCPGEGLFLVMSDTDVRRRLVCWFCLREGFTKGWWVTFYRADDVYDQEATA